MSQNLVRNFNMTFLRSAARLEQLPADEGCEVAFIGRSNAGKSSAINIIANTKNIARVGKKPGVTQLLNVFLIDPERRVIDLPGYGYAKAPPNVRAKWLRLVNHYLQKRQSLRGLFLLMDIRHPLRDLDIDLLNWAVQVFLPVSVLLTKADKLKTGAANKILQDVAKELQAYGDGITVQLFSAKTRLGLERVITQMDDWLSPSLDFNN